MRWPLRLHCSFIDSCVLVIAEDGFTAIDGGFGGFDDFADLVARDAGAQVDVVGAVAEVKVAGFRVAFVILGEGAGKDLR